MSHQDSCYLRYAIALFAEFAHKFNLKDSQAFKYIKRYGGLEYLREYYDVLHTLSFEEVVEGLARICNKNGGRLKYA